MAVKKVTTKQSHILYGTRCYLIGHMQYTNGRSWREIVKKKLSKRGIRFFDPYYKPFMHDIPEDEEARIDLNGWMETGQYDLVQSRMWDVRGYDLRLCDVCDFFIAHIVPNVASWGSAEEITTVIREKKPLFLSVEGGKKKTPLWLMGAIPHKYIYDKIEDVIDMVSHIDAGYVKLNSERWKLLKPEYRL